MCCRAGGPAGGSALQTRPLPQAPQEAAPVKGLRCAAPGARLSGFCAGRVSRQGLALGSAALGLPERAGHHCYIKPCWKVAKGECPGHLRLVRPAAAGALCVFTPQPAGPCCARCLFSKGPCWSAPCPHAFCSVFRGLAGVPPPPELLASLSLPDRTEACCSFKESRLLTVTHFWLSARKIASAWPTEKKPNNFSFVCGVTFHCPPFTPVLSRFKC